MTKEHKLYVIIAASATAIAVALAVYFLYYLPNKKTKGMKTVTNKGLNIIKKFERLYLTAYLCPAGKPTIGYGHTSGVSIGDTCTEAQANAWLEDDVNIAETAVNAQNLRISQNQFDALVSFVFNVGEPRFKNSTLLKKIKANPDDPTIADEFAKWRTDGKNVLSGLVKRREAESSLYFA